METLFLLIGSHYLGDFGLQSDWMAEHKIPGAFLWVHVLFAHSFIHGLGVFLVTHSLILAVIEVVAHFTIDYAKGRQWIGFNQDQALHILFKVLYCL